MKKNALVIAIICFLLLGVLVNTGWGKEHILYPSQAKRNATQYIREKYGIKAKVKSLEIFVKDNSGSPILSLNIKKPLKEAWVIMEYEGKEFEVNIAWGDEKEQFDNYQQDVIARAVKEEFTEMIGEPAHINVNSGLSSKFFDGNNLVEVLETSLHGTNTAYVFVVDADLSDLTYDKMTQVFGENFKGHILNCKDMEGVDKMVELETDYFISKKDIEIYSPYLIEVYEFSGYLPDGVKYIEINE